MALNFPVSTETSGYSATHRKMVARNPDWLVLRNLSVFVQEALLALRQIDGAHVYLPGEGSVLGLRAGNYIDSSGTLAGVLDSPVGLTLDALGVLGPELVTNGNFSSGLTGWYVGENISATIVSGEAQVTFVGPLTSTAANWFSAGPVVSTGDTRLFNIEFDATFVSGAGSLQVGVGYVNQQVIEPNVGKTRYRVAAAGLRGGPGNNVGGSAIVFGATAASTVWKIDNVTVREITGIHASQNTTADKPKLTRRVNLFLATNNANSNTDGSSTTQHDTTIAPDGTMTADTVTIESGSRGYNYNFVTTAAIAYTLYVYYKKGTASVVGLSTSSLNPHYVRYNFDTDDVTVGTNAISGGRTILSNGWVRVYVTGIPTGSVITRNLLEGVVGDTAIVWGASITTAENAHLPYQRVNTATDYDTFGFPPARWDFDTTDRLNLTLPAGYESATIIDATPAGPVTLLEQDVTGTYGIVGGLTAAELVTNGDFSNSLTGWENASTGTGTATATDGHIVLVGDDASNRGGIKTRIATTVGRAYQLRWRVVSGSVNSQIAVTGAGNAYDKFGATTPGVFSAIFVASANPSTLLFNVYANGTVVVDDFSVKESLPSTHGRIILRDTPTPRQLELCQGLANRLAGL
jgi:hypothetical protein